ncbi:iron chelate uptake ABC transporter family permease subunit [Conexibacter sp. JD483]|uniref:iron chelate uptake ABC transporter family permease subunit n=1 Tax=unclassified Conexibacter TaxID=2627773 RepID=UPI002715706F|nr:MULTISPECIES: iron chelate uptake ABC transporter family permease subunit [unclassified Conexibacter]MDO8187603.1 iron chelate uptake ABC transporter family permease subunit [Conexibacter sp. CPCC 205706]MDO8201065.1 iron chelate uptake ABC transporter family permease subunit [Conexibacter sp. CPCC 205762]MDR9371830.1 iron chelate uptake ABC transporter family permease subunit [Conexibacter sp. JD483]
MQSSSRSVGLAIALAALALAVFLSLALGARSIPLADVIGDLFHPDGSQDATIVHELRLPRTLLGLGVGAALGLAGALMQALTRNPLADPGLLGVNAGAAAAVVIAVGLFGIGGLTGYVWFAFAGAGAAAVVVYLLAAAGRGGATPVRLALAGTAVTAALLAVTQAVTLLDREAFETWRFWWVGSLAGRDSETLAQVAPFLIAGALLALALARPLNALALGDDAGRALGAHVGRTRVLGGIAITLLCGAATAAAGPIAFIGLAIPHVARAIVGPDQRWVLAYSLVLAPLLLLVADVLGRLVVSPQELQVGVVTAFVGAPLFIALVRRRRIAQL